MEITLEKIDSLRERANVSYAEAKAALEQNDGNMIDAIIYLESEDKTVYDRAKRSSAKNQERERAHARRAKCRASSDEFATGCQKLFKSLNETRVVMYNNERVVLDISSTVALLGLFVPPVTISIFIIALLTGNKFKIIRKDKKADVFNAVLNKAAKVSQDVANNLKEKVKEVTEAAAATEAPEAPEAPEVEKEEVDLTKEV